MQKLGFSSVCYDQLFADRLCYSAEHGHKPQDLLLPLYDLAKQALRDGQTIDPEATFSGEFFNDISQTFQHYNWDWITGDTSLDQLEPFRYVFPRFRLGILVGVVRVDPTRQAIAALALASEEAKYVWYWKGDPQVVPMRIAVEMQRP